MAWREKVYNGTLRPKTTEVISGANLSDLLDGLNMTVRSNYATTVSDAHDVNKIVDGLYLGDKYTAKDKRFLVRQGFTHVLNAAEGIDELQVNTNEYYYRDVKIKYMGIPGHDRPSWNISVYFEQTSKFIDNAIKSGGKVFVHCVVGISRSATIVIAYLMMCRNMNAAEALSHVFKQRRVFPNIGFLHQLAQLDSRLKNQIPALQSRLYL